MDSTIIKFFLVARAYLLINKRETLESCVLLYSQDYAALAEEKRNSANLRNCIGGSDTCNQKFLDLMCV